MVGPLHITRVGTHYIPAGTVKYQHLLLLRMDPTTSPTIKQLQQLPLHKPSNAPTMPFQTCRSSRRNPPKNLHPRLQTRERP